MAIEVSSYLRHRADGQFTRIEDVIVPPPYPHRIEGAIELTLDGVHLMDTYMWDEVDQLWILIANAIHELESTDRVYSFIPDEDIRTTWERLGAGRIRVSFDVNDIVHTVSTNEADLIKCLCEQGLVFFATITRLIPVNKKRYKEAVDHLEVALATAGGTGA